MSRISMEETRKVIASSLSCTLVRNWPCRKTAGLLNHNTSSVPGNESAIFQPSVRLIGIGQHQIGGLTGHNTLQRPRQPFRGATRKADGNGLAPAGVQRLRF